MQNVTVDLRKRASLLLCITATTTTATTTSTLTLCPTPTLARCVERWDRQQSTRSLLRLALQLQNQSVLPKRKWENAFRFQAGSLSDTQRQSRTKETWDVKQVTGRCIINEPLLRQCRVNVVSILQAVEQTGAVASKSKGFSLFGLNIKATTFALLVHANHFCLMDDHES